MSEPQRLEDPQADIGRQVRALRLARNQSQSELAHRAHVALGALKSLENGGGATLRTLAAVVVALDRGEWLLGLQPSQAVAAGRLRAGKPKKPATAPAAGPEASGH